MPLSISMRPAAKRVATGDPIVARFDVDEARVGEFVRLAVKVRRDHAVSATGVNRFRAAHHRSSREEQRPRRQRHNRSLVVPHW